MHNQTRFSAVQEIDFPDCKYPRIAESGAVFSSCGQYRYRLWRIWNHALPLVFWLMHNPSTAGHITNDPTIKRCIAFTKSWGYGGLYVGNLFPYRATNPAHLAGKPLSVLIPLGNYGHLQQMAALCRLHVAAFGNTAVAVAMPQLPGIEWHCLKTTKTHNPCHPLYVKASEPTKPFMPHFPETLKYPM